MAGQNTLNGNYSIPGIDKVFQMVSKLILQKAFVLQMTIVNQEVINTHYEGDKTN